MALKKTEIPKSYAPVMPYLRVKGAAKAIEFYKNAFGAKERYRLAMGDRLGHAEIEIDGVVVMLGDEFPEMGALGPKSLKGTTVTLARIVTSTDRALEKAVAAGAKVVRPAQDEFYGYRSATIEDPFGHHWMIQQHLADVSPKEMQRRLDEMMAETRSNPPKAKTMKSQA